MVTLNAHFDGKTIVLDEPFSIPLPTGTRLTVRIERIDAPPASPPLTPHFQPLNIQIPAELSNQIATDHEFNIEES
ncbi:MAG TPA: hypothetical protein VM008_18000 [Phycisphaerae bacterium]|nr:hypothetical protein [Phycisphaerae bacterium]